MIKLCTKCRQTKPVSDFWIDRTRGHPKSHCKTCTIAATRAWRKNNPDYERNRYARERAETRERHLVRKYGVTLVDYERMLAAQGGVCAICSSPEESQHKGVFHVDHCHETGRVRGLLCRGCNHVLGHLRDDPKLLQNAIDYLRVPQIPELIGRAILQARAA